MSCPANTFSTAAGIELWPVLLVTDNYGGTSARTTLAEARVVPNAP